MKCTSLPRTLAALSISWYHSNAWMVQVGSQLLFWALPSQRTATLQNKRQKLEALSGRNEGTQYTDLLVRPQRVHDLLVRSCMVIGRVLLF